MKLTKFGSFSVKPDADGALAMDINECDFDAEGVRYEDDSALHKAAAVELLLFVAECCGAPLVETILMRYAASPSGRTH